MVIGDEVKRLTLLLQRNRRPHHAEVIADVQNAAGLDAGKDAHWIEGERSTSDAQRPTFNATSAAEDLPARARLQVGWILPFEDDFAATHDAEPQPGETVFDLLLRFVRPDPARPQLEA